MAALRLILGDQLSASVSCLEGLDKREDVILMCEVTEEATYVKHHPKKIAFLFSAMRHFAAELRQQKITVRYVALDDPANTGSLDGEVQRALAETQAETLVLTEPGEWRVLQKFEAWQQALPAEVEIREDTRFLCSRAAFARWMKSKRQPRMEFFYRDMRKKHGILLEEGEQPVGGRWNFDKENRQPPVRGVKGKHRLSFRKDKITREVLALVRQRFGHHFGDLEPFHFSVTRTQALAEAKLFMQTMLPTFGTYQDAMVAGDAYLYHSLLSAYLNAGLLLPREVCQMAEAAYHAGHAPLNAVEGFIRQILGWREFVRGVYWHAMPEYAERNHLKAKRKLPGFYWGYDTKMFCMQEAVAHTRVHAYSHHIQRLMLTGNFALLAGLSVAEVCEWYLAVYADAYEWVELPNVLGMALYADGGVMGSKPYAASGKYIHRMSNYCEKCAYDPDETVGGKACPFNTLYWDFLARHEAKLRRNPRLNYTYASWDKMAAEKQQAIRAQAKDVFRRLDKGAL